MIELDEIVKQVDAKRDTYVALADQVWGLAEIRFKEQKSVAAHLNTLGMEDFRIIRNVAGMETAFVAEAGQRGPRDRVPR